MTKRIAHTALIALLLPVAGPAFAQVAAPPPAPADQASGGMTLGQFQAAQAQRMMAADTDGDGRISQAEWIAQSDARRASGGHAYGGGGGGGVGGGGGGYDPARGFARIDTNGDGFIDRTELDAASAERFRRMDLNGDGILTPDERAAMRGGAGQHGDHRGRSEDQRGQPTPPVSTPQR